MSYNKKISKEYIELLYKESATDTCEAKLAELDQLVAALKKTGSLCAIYAEEFIQEIRLTQQSADHSIADTTLFTLLDNTLALLRAQSNSHESATDMTKHITQLKGSLHELTYHTQLSQKAANDYQRRSSRLLAAGLGLLAATVLAGVVAASIFTFGLPAAIIGITTLVLACTGGLSILAANIAKNRKQFGLFEQANQSQHLTTKLNSFITRLSDIPGTNTMQP